MLSLAFLKAISICIMNGTSPFQPNNLWNCLLGDSSLATASSVNAEEDSVKFEGYLPCGRWGQRWGWGPMSAAHMLRSECHFKV